MTTFQSQLDQLLTVANQCPGEGGPAVFRARSILTQYQIENYEEGMEYYHFSNDCESGNDTERIGKAAETRIQPNFRFEVSPNPAWNQLHLAFKAEGAKQISFELFDTYGKRVLHKRFFQEEKQTVLGINHFASGLYFYRWTVDNKVQESKRFMILR